MITPRMVVPESGLIDEWIPYDVSKNRKAISGKFSQARLLYHVRRKNFDAAAYLLSRDRSIGEIERDLKFFEFAGIGRVIGGEYMRNNCFESRSRPPSEKVVSESHFLLDCLRSEGIETIDDSSNDLLRLSESEKNKAKDITRANFADFDRSRIIAVGPGGKRPSRRWARERFENVIGSLIEKKNVFPVFFGGREDRALADEILRTCGKGINTCGELSIREAAAVLGECGLYLGNDTGTMHLAAAVGTPCVAVFSAADRNGQWEPFGQGHTFFRRSVECEGCRIDICDRNNLCLELIDNEEVLSACIATIERNERSINKVA